MSRDTSIVDIDVRDCQNVSVLTVDSGVLKVDVKRCLPRDCDDVIESGSVSLLVPPHLRDYVAYLSETYGITSPLIRKARI